MISCEHFWVASWRFRPILWFFPRQNTLLSNSFHGKWSTAMISRNDTKPIPSHTKTTARGCFEPWHPCQQDQSLHRRKAPVLLPLLSWQRIKKGIRKNQTALHSKNLKIMPFRSHMVVLKLNFGLLVPKKNQGAPCWPSEGTQPEMLLSGKARQSSQSSRSQTSKCPASPIVTLQSPEWWPAVVESPMPGFVNAGMKWPSMLDINVKGCNEHCNPTCATNKKQTYSEHVSCSHDSFTQQRQLHKARKGKRLIVEELSAIAGLMFTPSFSASLPRFRSFKALLRERTSGTNTGDTNSKALIGWCDRRMIQHHPQPPTAF